MTPSSFSFERFLSGGAAAAAAAAVLCQAGAAAAQTPVVIDGVSGEMRAALVRTLPEREKPQSLFDAERLSDEAASRAMKWLRAEGYYGADVVPDPADSPPTARIRISPGPLFVLDTPVITFSGAEPDAAAADAARSAINALRAGAPARAADVLQAEADAVAALKAHGRPDAKAGPRRVVVDHEKKLMAAQFSLDAGARVTLGGVSVTPEKLLRPSFVDRLPSWKRGEPYSPDRLAVLRRDLASTGAFSTVTTSIAEQPNEDGTRDVVVTLEKAKPHVIEFGAGWSTTEGAGIDAKWTRRNVTRRADSLTFDATLAEQRQTLTAEIDEPNARGSGRALRLTGDITHDTSGPYQRTGVSASAAVDAARRLRFARTYGVSVSADFYNQAQGVENAIVLSGFVDVRRDTTDALLDARKGYLVEARLEPGFSTGDATVPYVRATTQARYFVTPPNYDRMTFAARARLGWVEPISGSADDLPLDRLFYAGGGGSVRGYDFNSIYPVTTSTLSQPPGGRGLVEVSVEARARVTKKFGAVAFVDGGTAFNDLADAGDLRWGAGFGVRYDLGFAPLRFDVAAPISPRANDAPVAFYVSIGQAF